MWKKIADSKWFYAAVSILLAFILWIYVGKEVNPVTSHYLNDVQVVFSGLEKLEERGLMISEGAEQTVSLYLQAKKTVFQQLAQADTTVIVDVSNITEPGEMSLAVAGLTINWPRLVSSSNVELRFARPERIEFTVSRLIEKQVPVRAVFRGSLAENFQAGEFSCAPEVVTIRGREETVSLIDHALVTVAEAGLSSTYSEDIPFTLVDAAGEAVDTTGLEIDPSTVLVTLPVVQLKPVPLTVDLILGGGVTDPDTQVEVKISPESIMVSGDSDDLEGLKELSLGSVDLSTIYGNGTSGGGIKLPIQLSPELTNVSGVTEAKVTIAFQGLATRTLEVNNIELINVPDPDRYTVDKVTQTSVVLIRGTQEAVDAVAPSQLRIVADLKDVEPMIGSKTVQVKVYLDGSGEAGVVGTYNIVVSFSAA